MRKSSAETIENYFKDKVPNIATIHWDAKLLSIIGLRRRKEERLAIIISYNDKE